MKRTILITRIITIIAIIFLVGGISYKIFSTKTKEDNTPIPNQLGLVKNDSVNKIMNEKDLQGEDIKVADNTFISNLTGKKLKVFYGLSTSADPNTVSFTNLTALNNSASRITIGTKSFNASSSQYIYFAWPIAFESSDNCKHDGNLGTVDCFMSGFGSVVNFVRGTQTYDNIPYFVYKSRDKGVSATYTIQ